MSEALSVGNLLVGGGLSAVLVALIGAVFGRRMRQADYARALVETATDITERADQRAQRLDEKVDQLEAEIDDLKDTVGLLTSLLRTAIPLLQAAGHDTIAAEMRTALVRRPA
ncbi:hypothetical protein [Nocardia farcinica]|uniref:hypothetical protein n=1 Tax=Nocardia farcinica TaxID=37329 RepID=UPI0024585AB9|nr:hypothetical protein [Nocardia farcinica]